MTAQIPDEVRFRGDRYAVTAVEGVGLFDPTGHGIEPGSLGSACRRGFVALYSIRGDQLELSAVRTGRPVAQSRAPTLFGVRASKVGAKDALVGALRPRWPTCVTGWVQPGCGRPPMPRSSPGSNGPSR